jgi:outer membrane protein TolC
MNPKEKNKLMKQILIIFLLLPNLYSAAAQNGYSSVLQQIEQNSPTLLALRQQTDAQQLNARTGIYLPNPEVEINYLRGPANGIGNDFALRQSFDFPTAYGHRRQIADLQNDAVEQSYQSERLNILLRAQQVCIELIYYNALHQACAQNLRNAQTLAAAYRTQMEQGETNRLEYNKAQLNLSAVEAEKNRIEAAQTALQLQLQQMNGGLPLLFDAADYPLQPLPPDLETARLATQHPALRYADRQIEISRRQLQLNRALALPALSAGYMSENRAGERFQGLTLGLSLPLWENKNRVKQAKMQLQAAQSTRNDSQTQLQTQFQTLYLQAQALQKNALALRASLRENNNEPLLQKALQAGQISLLTYLLETEYLYAALQKTLEAERDYALALAQLQAPDL